MIDLRFKELPSHIECDGILYALNTDFRVWLEFDYLLKDGILWDGIFKDKVPSGSWHEAAQEFLISENATPRNMGCSSARALDYILDGDYITAAFQQAYGIDLTSIEYMHWHRFSALLKGLPDNTKLSQIMGYRVWRPNKKKFEDQMRHNRLMWTLPSDDEEEIDPEVLEWTNEFFGEG